MNLKTLLLSTTLLLSPLLCEGQTVSTSDTVCIEYNKFKFFVESTEKYYICQKISNEKDTIILQMEKILIEKQEQAQMSEIYINSFRNEVERLQRHRTILGVGLGISLIAVLLLAL